MRRAPQGVIDTVKGVIYYVCTYFLVLVSAFIRGGITN